MGVMYNAIDANIQLELDDFNELKQRVYSQFGWPTVAIEIGDDSFKYIIKKAISYLNTYSPREVLVSKTVRPYVTLYEMFDYPQVNGVLDVFVSVEYLIGLGLPIQTVLGVPMSLAASRNSQHLINFISMFQAYDVAKRMFGTKPHAELVRPNFVSINPAPFMETIFKFDLAVDHLPNLSSLNDYEINWLERFCQANVGKVLGQIRRKYSGVTLPVGALDASGNSLYAESVEMENALIEELKSRHKFPETFIAVG